MLPEFYEISEYEQQQNFLKQEAEDEEALREQALIEEWENRMYGQFGNMDCLER